MQLPLLLDRLGGESLTSQIVGQVRRAIEQGLLARGAQLPSSRRLADQLEIGRNTVIRAYEALGVDGLIETRPGAGVFVAAEARAPIASAPEGARAPRWSMPIPAAPVASAPRSAKARPSYDLTPGRTHVQLFPLKQWRRLIVAELAHNGAAGLADAVEPGGLPALRSAIATHLAATRGILVEPNRIFVTSGLQHAAGLVAQLFLRPGSLVAMEDPGPASMRMVFEAAGADVVGVEVDADGLSTDHLPERSAALLHVTPSHQFPTGNLLSHRRREALAVWARRNGCYIVEDDRDGEFRYDGANPPAIAAIAPDCALYLGSFARTLGPGLKLGFLVVPPQLAEAMATTQALFEGGPSWLEQAALAEMIASQAYAHHVARIRVHYRESRDSLLNALKRNYGEIGYSGERCGLHVLWHLPPGVPDASAIEAAARRRRIGIHALESAGATFFRSSLIERRALLIGFGALSPRQIALAVDRLSEAIDDAIDDPATDVSDFLVSVPFSMRSEPTSRRGGEGRLDPRFRRQLALALRPRARSTSGKHETRPADGAMAIVKNLFVYPIKGLSPQPLAVAAIRAGMPFEHDREFALARPNAPLDAEDPKWAKKGNFAMLMLDEGLARCATYVDLEDMRLRVEGPSRQTFVGRLDRDEDRRGFEQFLWSLLPNFAAPPTLVRSRGGHFMDKPDNVISLINLATVRALEQRWSVKVDPLRFRANIYVDGPAPWSEFDWIGQSMRIGDVDFVVDRRNGRCGATNVNPVTAERDLDIPRYLRTAFGHKDLGVYLVARGAGRIGVGDSVELSSDGAVAPRPTPAVVSTTAFEPRERRFICSGCYLIYDEDAGLPDKGLPAGSPFAAIPEGWRCPDCGSPKALFRKYAPAGAAAAG